MESDALHLSQKKKRFSCPMSYSCEWIYSLYYQNNLFQINVVVYCHVNNMETWPCHLRDILHIFLLHAYYISRIFSQFILPLRISFMYRCVVSIFLIHYTPRPRVDMSLNMHTTNMFPYHFMVSRKSLCRFNISNANTNCKYTHWCWNKLGR